MSNKSDAKRSKIKKRIRRIVFGSQERPRLSVFRSNKEIYAQVINDVDQKTLVAASSKDKDLKIETTDKIEISKLVGMSVGCLLYTSPSPRDISGSRMPSSA